MMDVQRFNFPAKLLDILTSISEAHFVALDLELSGVPVRQHGAQRKGKATLQERYSETKAAAEKYTILQVGITCVKEDQYAGTYELKPYNIPISPILSERLDIDRDFTFHSGAVEFLNGVGFNFQAPMAIGVPYLSRKEERLASERAKERLSRNQDSFAPMVLKDEDIESLALIERVRKEVTRWMETGKPDGDSLILGPQELSTAVSRPEYLSRFEKRLIHQTVRSDFPTLITVPSGAIIQVMGLDQDREDAHRKQRMKEVKERIYRQKGFSWIVEAIAGRSLDKLDWKFLLQQGQGEGDSYVNFDVKSTFQRAQSLLRDKPRPVVGHNMFLDLIYLYHHFVDELPEKVEDFQAKMHELFPTVIDTKYLATHECGDINPMSSLQQLAEQLENQEKPIITVHASHHKYEDFDAYHEAGYDSMLTAKVAIRLSSKLEAEKRSAQGEGDPGAASNQSLQDVKSTAGVDELSKKAEQVTF